MDPSLLSKVGIRRSMPRGMNEGMNKQEETSQHRLLQLPGGIRANNAFQRTEHF